MFAIIITLFIWRCINGGRWFLHYLSCAQWALKILSIELNSKMKRALVQTAERNLLESLDLKGIYDPYAVVNLFFIWWFNDEPFDVNWYPSFVRNRRMPVVNEYFKHIFYFSNKNNVSPRPGIEPGPSTWQAEILTTRLSRIVLSKPIFQIVVWYETKKRK